MTTHLGHGPDDPGESYLAALDDAALDAALEAMVLVAAADGVLGDAEKTRLVESVTLLARGRLTATDAARRLEQIATETAQAGRDARLATLGARLPDERARRVTLVLAADVAAADGVLHETEQRQCLALAAALGIAPEEAAALGIDATPADERG